MTKKLKKPRKIQKHDECYQLKNIGYLVYIVLVEGISPFICLKGGGLLA